MYKNRSPKTSLEVLFHVCPFDIGQYPAPLPRKHTSWDIAAKVVDSVLHMWHSRAIVQFHYVTTRWLEKTCLAQKWHDKIHRWFWSIQSWIHEHIIGNMIYNGSPDSSEASMVCVFSNSCKEAMTDEEVYHAHQLPVVVGWTVHLIQERWERYPIRFCFICWQVNVHSWKHVWNINLSGNLVAISTKINDQWWSALISLVFSLRFESQVIQVTRWVSNSFVKQQDPSDPMVVSHLH